jgi:hypothetical protein
MIKRVLSVSLALMMLFALLHIAVATHYCGGRIEAASISLSGKLASCGMEDDHSDLHSAGTSISRHCCDNVLKFYGINGNYFPTFYSIPDSFRNLSHVMLLSAELPQVSAGNIKSFIANASPPGVMLPNSVDLSVICSLLI